MRGTSSGAQRLQWVFEMREGVACSHGTTGEGYRNEGTPQTSSIIKIEAIGYACP